MFSKRPRKRRTGDSRVPGGGRAPFVKLAFLRGNGAFFGSKQGHFRRFRTTFSMDVAHVLYFIASLVLWC